MAEIHDALRLANRVLDIPSRDPDDDLSMMSRQFLRAFEANKNLVAKTERLESILATVQELATDTPTKKTMEMALDGIVRLCEDALSA